MAAIPIMMAVSAAVSAAAAASAAEQKARAQNQAADAANQAGGIAAAQGYGREDVSRRQSAQRLAMQYAAGSQSGIAQGTGSALDVATNSATNAEYDALTTRYAGLSQRDQFMQQAANLHASARNTRAGGYFKAGAGLVSSIAGAMGPSVAPTTNPLGGGFGTMGTSGGISGDSAFGP